MYRAREHCFRQDCSGQWYLQTSLLVVIHSHSLLTTSACEVPKPKTSFPSLQRPRNTPLGLYVLAAMSSWTTANLTYPLSVSLGSNWVSTLVLSSHDMATKIHSHPGPLTAGGYSLLLMDKKSMIFLNLALTRIMQGKQKATLRVILPFEKKECGWTENAFLAHWSSRFILHGYFSTSQHLHQQHSQACSGDDDPRRSPDSFCSGAAKRQRFNEG